MKICEKISDEISWEEAQQLDVFWAFYDLNYRGNPFTFHFKFSDKDERGYYSWEDTEKVADKIGNGLPNKGKGYKFHSPEKFRFFKNPQV